MQGGHGSFEKAFQVVRRVFGQVFHLSSQSCKAFGLGRRPQGDPKVSSELQWGAEGVTLNNVCFDRDGCPSQLIKERSGPWMIRCVALFQRQYSCFVTLLPCEKGSILVHCVTLAIAFNTVSTSLHRIVHLPSPISHLLILRV